MRSGDGMADYSSVLLRIEGLRSIGHERRWQGRCPVCGRDKRPSLRLWVDERSGKLLCKCYRGNCSWSDINAALGCRGQEWFPPSDNHHRRHATRRNVVTEATYNYCDENGTLLFQVLRQREADGSKRFTQRRPIPNYPGEWAYSLAAGRYNRDSGGTWRLLSPTLVTEDSMPLPAVRIVPWQLPMLARQPDWPIIVVEGEKDVLTLLEVFKGQQMLVTTSPGGAGKWRLNYGGFLTGRRVAVIPDNDEVGQMHALTVVASAIQCRARAVRLVRWTYLNWPDAPEGGDVTDWLRDRHHNGVVADKRKAILDLIKAEEAWEPRGAT